ncbi:MAG: hypothetical protein WA641_12780 [Candidatus Acidiferrales bacterium]
MDSEGIVRVLLVGGDPREFFASRQLFEWNGCLCHFSGSDQEAAELLNSAKFDIVLGTHEIAGGSIDQFAASLSGSRTSLFYSMPGEKGYRWLPVLQFGKQCFGTPALTAGELIYVLDRLVKQIRADFEASTS